MASGLAGTRWGYAFRPHLRTSALFMSKCRGVLDAATRVATRDAPNATGLACPRDACASVGLQRSTAFAHSVAPATRGVTSKPRPHALQHQPNRLGGGFWRGNSYGHPPVSIAALSLECGFYLSGAGRFSRERRGVGGKSALYCRSQPCRG